MTTLFLSVRPLRTSRPSSPRNRIILTLERDVLDLDFLCIPLSEKLDGACLWGSDGSNVLWYTNSSHIESLRRGVGIRVSFLLALGVESVRPPVQLHCETSSLPCAIHAAMPVTTRVTSLYPCGTLVLLLPSVVLIPPSHRTSGHPIVPTILSGNAMPFFFLLFRSAAGLFVPFGCSSVTWTLT